MVSEQDLSKAEAEAKQVLAKKTPVRRFRAGVDVRKQQQQLVQAKQVARENLQRIKEARQVLEQRRVQEAKANVRRKVFAQLQREAQGKKGSILDTQEERRLREKILAENPQIRKAVIRGSFLGGKAREAGFRTIEEQAIAGQFFEREFAEPTVETKTEDVRTEIVKIETETGGKLTPEVKQAVIENVQQTDDRDRRKLTVRVEDAVRQILQKKENIELGGITPKEAVISFALGIGAGAGSLFLLPKTLADQREEIIEFVGRKKDPREFVEFAKEEFREFKENPFFVAGEFVSGGTAIKGVSFASDISKIATAGVKGKLRLPKKVTPDVAKEERIVSKIEDIPVKEGTQEIGVAKPVKKLLEDQSDLIKKIEGARVEAVSVATNIVRTGQKKIEVTKQFFADPFGRARVSRIGEEVGLLKLISDPSKIRISFKREKPQILTFPDEVVEKLPPRLSDVKKALESGRGLTPSQQRRFQQFLEDPSGRFKPFGKPQPTREPEVTLPVGETIEVLGKRATTIVRGRVTPIFEAKTLKGTAKGVADDVKKTTSSVSSTVKDVFVVPTAEVGAGIISVGKTKLSRPKGAVDITGVVREIPSSETAKVTSLPPSRLPRPTTSIPPTSPSRPAPSAPSIPSAPVSQPISPPISPIISPSITPPVSPPPSTPGGSTIGRRFKDDTTKLLRFPRPKRKKDEEELLPGFRVLVRRKGVFKTVATDLPKGKALKIGSDVVRTTLGATFKLQPTGRRIRGKRQPFKLDPRIFRKPLPTSKLAQEPLVFIQKKGGRKEPTIPGARLSTPGELREIALARARRRR